MYDCVKEEEEELGLSGCVKAKEIIKMHRVSTKIVLLVVACLGVLSGRFKGFLKDIEISEMLG